MDLKQRRPWWDWKSYRYKRAVRSSIACETQVNVETLDMLELFNTFF